jgi:spore coat protein U-like protein
VSIDLSVGKGGVYLPWRTMLTAVGNHPLQYNLYQDAALTKVFGDGTGATFHHGPQILPIFPTKVSFYGFIPPSQNAWVGDYTDDVTITMNF